MNGFKLLMKMKWNRFKKPNLETNMFDFQKKWPQPEMETQEGKSSNILFASIHNHTLINT